MLRIGQKVVCEERLQEVKNWPKSVVYKARLDIVSHR